MCGRYYVPDEDSAADLREIIEQINRRANAGPVVKTGEIAPSDVAPVLANNRNLAATPFAMRWGYRLGNGKLLFNARSETADAKALFRDGMRHRRCLVPAAHYFEWEKRGKDRIGKKLPEEMRCPSFTRARLPVNGLLGSNLSTRNI